jgi:hypothetical protein
LWYSSIGYLVALTLKWPHGGFLAPLLPLVSVVSAHSYTYQCRNPTGGRLLVSSEGFLSGNPPALWVLLCCSIFSIPPEEVYNVPPRFSNIVRFWAKKGDKILYESVLGRF